MKIEIPKTYSDISSALLTGRHWSGSAESGSVVSNVSVLFGSTQEEKFIRGVKSYGDVIYVTLLDMITTERVELSAEDIVYVDQP